MSCAECRILLVDDQPDFLDLARALLAPGSGFEIVDSATDGAVAMQAVAATRPDAVLLDIEMPGWNGFETARRLLQRWPSLRIVLVSADDDTQYGVIARAIGATAFLAKKDLSAARLRELLCAPISTAAGPGSQRS